MSGPVFPRKVFSRKVFPRKDFRYYLLATTCLSSSLAMTSYGLLSVLGPIGAAAAVTASLGLILGLMWDERNNRVSDPENAPTQRISRIFNHLAKRAGLRGAIIEMSDRAIASCNTLGHTPKIKLGRDTVSKMGPYQIAALIGHELGHHYYSPHLPTINRCATIAGAWGMLGLSIGAAASAVFGPTNTAPDFGQNLYDLFLATTAGNMLFSPFSRAIETKCDQFSVALTGCPNELTSNIKRIYTQLNLESPYAPLLVDQHGNERLVTRAISLISAHPSIKARIKYTRTFAAQIDNESLQRARAGITRAAYTKPTP